MVATKRQMTGAQRMLAACRLQPVDATPVWFMRQAGRCLPEYRALRQKYDLLTMAKTPDLCAQVTLMPVQRLGVDAAVMFADIMLPLEGMGVPFRIEPESGPIVAEPIRTAADVKAVRVIEAAEATPYLFEAIRIVRRDLGKKAALIGFAGSPFTLACYLIEGKSSRTYDKAKAFMFREPVLWHDLMGKVTEVVVRYLREQVKSGVQVVQLFDSWVGALGPHTYDEFVFPYSKRIFDQVRELGVPSIHFGTGNPELLEPMARAGGDLIGLDWRIPLDVAWKRIGYDRGVQGNLDPAMLLGPFDRVQAAARDILRRAGRRPGHVFNLGHGVLPDTDPDHLARLVDLVHQESRRTA